MDDLPILFAYCSGRGGIQATAWPKVNAICLQLFGSKLFFCLEVFVIELAHDLAKLFAQDRWRGCIEVRRQLLGPRRGKRLDLVLQLAYDGVIVSTLGFEGHRQPRHFF